jgi:hypothetical protein
MDRYVRQLGAKLPPTQNDNFVMLMLLAVIQSLSGNMLRLPGFLRTGESLLPMSPESERLILKKYAEQHADLTSRQLQRLKSYGGLHAFLWKKLLGKQSWQPCQMRIRIDFLRHLMTMCIPRILITPNRTPENPVKPAWQLTGTTVFYDRSGFMYNGRSHDWTVCHHHVTAIISHLKKPLIALMHSNGIVSIGEKGVLNNIFQVIYIPREDNEKASAIAFHPFDSKITVAISARIILYKISPSLNPELHCVVSFYESVGYFCPRPFSADNLDWHSSGTLLTASSTGNLSMCWSFDPATSKFSNGFNGGTKYAEICSFKKDMSPDLSCFSVEGKLAITTYSDGTLVTRGVVITEDKRISLICLKMTKQSLPGRIVNIVPHPHNPSVFAIQVKAGWSQTSVLIALVSPDGSVTITATIPDAKSPHFHEDWLLVLSRKKIRFHHMNRCNIPCLVTEFHLQVNGILHVEIDTFYVIKTPDGKIMLFYTDDEKSKLHIAEIKLK